MKRFSFKPLWNWFGYSRRERRSSFIIVIIIAVVASLRFLFPSGRSHPEIIQVQQSEKSPDTVKTMQSASSRVAYNTSSGRKRTIELLELNSSDSAALEALPGIGPVLSARIIRYRNLLGGYASVEQLREVYGLKEETYDLIRNRLRVDISLVRKININTADYKQMIRLPYFTREEVSAILNYREKSGKLEKVDDLVINNLVSQGKIDKLRPYLSF